MSTEAIPLAARRRASAVATDYWLLVVALALIAFGTIMVASASMTIAEREGGAAFHYLFRHLVALGIALVSGLLLLRVSLEAWQRAAPFLYLSGLVLLVLVLLPGVGRTANGATRWISVGGFNLQSSELMKLFMVVYIAAYMVRRREEVIGTVWGFVKPMLLLGVVSVLIIKQPDFGTTAVLVATTMAMLFLGGVALWPFVVLVGGAFTALVSLVVISPYRMQRVTAFLDPWADPFDSGFQLTQALIAFGRGSGAESVWETGFKSSSTCPKRTPTFCSQWSGKNSDWWERCPLSRYSPFLPGARCASGPRPSVRVCRSVRIWPTA